MKKINKIKILSVFIIIMFSISLMGCSRVDDLKVKFGFKNNDFEYIKDGKIQKIVIQNTRDQGYRFIVTDQKAIKDLYEMFSTAKVVKEKSSLEPDYTFEMYDSKNNIYKFKYIAGLDKTSAGNFYNEGKVYIVSKRIDNDIIKNFWNIRIPKDFKVVYYNSILEVLDQYTKDNKNKRIGINFQEDVDGAKFLLSTDLDEFSNKLKSKYSNVEIISGEKSNYEVIMTIKTEGYKRTLYKCSVSFWDYKQKSESKYFIWDEYLNNRWVIKATDKKPDGF